MLVVRLIGQAQHLAEGEVLVAFTARGHHPEQLLFRRVLGKLAVAIGQVDDDLIRVALPMAMDMVEEDGKTGAATAYRRWEFDPLFQRVGPINLAIDKVELHIQRGVGVADAIDLGQKLAQIVIGDGAAGIDGNQRRQVVLFILQGIQIEPLMDEATVIAVEIQRGAGQVTR